MFLSNINQESGTCEFLQYRIGWFNTDEKYARESKIILATMMKGTYDYQEHYIRTAGLYLTPEWLNFVFGTLLRTPQTKNYICGVSERCPDTNVGMSRQECVQRLEDLPLFSSEYHFDGKDYSCRSLHATFADINPDHCAHISFEPQEDPHGVIKCQKSANISYADIFDEDDFDGFYDYIESKESMIESRDGFVINDLPKQNNISSLVGFGGVVPALMMIVVFSGLSYKWRRDVSDDEGKDGIANENDAKLFANKNRQLWILIKIVIAAFILTYGLAALLVWAVVEDNPEWEADYDDDNVMVGSWISSPGAMQDSAPQSALSDRQFAVYSGFVVWIIVVTAGLGLELFVWYHFLQARTNAWADHV